MEGSSHHIFPGNTANVVAFKEMITSIKKRFRINCVVFVVDRGDDKKGKH